MSSTATLIRKGEHLVALASETVEHLMTRQPVGELPEHTPGWNQAFIGAVREVKDRYRDSPDLPALLRIVSEKLYGKEIHWALELIQNAEDEGAHRIVFIFRPDEVLIFNDGRPFTAEGVWAICSAGQSRKKNKIGFFGIGFKSVFLITDCPKIHSGPYAFQIEEKIYPSPLLSKRLQRGARFRLPVKDSEQPRLAAMAEQLAKPDFLQLLLTLNSLEKIHVIDQINGRKGHFYRRITRREQDGWDECVIGGTCLAATSRFGGDISEKLSRCPRTSFEKGEYSNRGSVPELYWPGLSAVKRWKRVYIASCLSMCHRS